VITICPYCSLTTAGEHEYSCPRHPSRLRDWIQPMFYFSNKEEYVWKNGHRYHLILDDPIYGLDDNLFPITDTNISAI
jgi:hypothetical protein